jgi:hypothetical protein
VGGGAVIADGPPPPTPPLKGEGSQESSVALYSTRTTSTDCLAVWLPLVRSTPTIGEMSE